MMTVVPTDVLANDTQPPTATIISGQDHDTQSEDHSIIIGPLALFLTLFTIAIAVLQYRRDRQRTTQSMTRQTQITALSTGVLFS